MFRYTQTNTQHHPRFAVVISKKVIQKAVERNKVRRIVYESLRVQKSFFPSWNGAKIVISVQKAGKELTKDIIFTEVQRFFDLKKQK